MLARVTSRGEGQGTACLSEDAVVGFLDGSLSREERERVERHVDTCVDCFGWMAAVVRTSLLTSRGVLAETVPLGNSPPPDGERDDEALAAGVTIGRYQIVERLGHGAMGIVYRAFDPILERDVAVKIMRGAPSSGLRMRALQEAQALAKLQHGNVIAVHDVGFFGERVFVAMELVEGETLTRWLQRPRRWQEVRDVFVDAARGLAAAHAAGLVHRDFKPDNVLLTSDGKRVVVTDFGLVCSLDVGDDGATHMAGTPAYMAPEQFTGGTVDARTDVFNFSACLYEALFGVPAFAGDTVADRKTAVLRGTLRPLAESPAPRWLRSVLLRGLERSRDARWPSMGALVSALDRDRRVRRIELGAASLVLVILVAIVSAGITSFRSPLAACRRRSGALADTWSGATRAAVGDGLRRTKRPFAGRVADTVTAILDRYVVDWSAAYKGLCDATYARGEQSLEAFDMRVDCLQSRRDSVRELVTQLAQADESMLNAAVTAVSALDSPATCVRQRPSPLRVAPPGKKLAIAAARQKLAQARSDTLLSRLDAADQLATSVLATARTIDFAPLTAESWQAAAYVRRARGKPADAEQAFVSAFDAAERGGADDLRADIAIELAQVVGYSEGHFADGRRWADEADAIAGRLGGLPDPRRAALTMNRGLVAQAEGKLDEAETLIRQAAELRRRVLSHDNPAVPLTFGNLASVLIARGQYREAERIFRQSYEELSALVGPTHPLSLSQRVNVAVAQYWLGHYRDAARTYRDVLEPQRQNLGAHHPSVILTLDNLADSESCVGDYEHAIEHGKQALDGALANNPDDPRIADLQMSLALYYSQHGDGAQAAELGAASLARNIARFGRGHSNVGIAEFQLARIALDVRRLDEAKAYATRALALLERGFGPRNPRWATTVDLLGVVDYEEGHAAAAIEKHQRALAVLEPIGHMGLPDVITNLGRAQLLAGHRVEALATLERAYALRAKIEGDPQAEATTAFALARALPPAASTRAHSLAVSARKGFVSGGVRWRREAAEVEQWLRTHSDREDER
jgi:tetratricopeptide (TPR) repeat protein